MKLYLSSVGFPTKSQFKQLTGKKYSEARIGFVMNAADWHTPAERKVRRDVIEKHFRRIGVKPDKLHLVDLRKFYNKKPTELVKKLLQYDLLWVRGGNTYFLRYVMKKSGFDSAIKKALSNGLVYASESAGSLAVGSTLRHIDKADDPSKAPKVIWQGIGLIKLVPMPHYNNPEYGNTIKEAYRKLRKEGRRVVKLVDGEALMVDGKSCKKVKANWLWKR